jgi:hypothetical protein
MSNLLGHVVLTASPNVPQNLDNPNYGTATATFHVPSSTPTSEMILVTCQLAGVATGVVPTVNGVASAVMFISSFTDGNGSHPVNSSGIHEAGILDITFTLDVNAAQATGLALIFAGL